MRLVKHLLEGKGGAVHWIGPEQPVLDAIRMMADKYVGALVVMDQGQMVGIVSERDYARKVILQGKSSHDMLVREIMTERVVCVQPKNTVEECMALMTDRRIRHLPVIESDKLLGVLSIGDLVKETISEQQFMIKQLESYIHS